MYSRNPCMGLSGAFSVIQEEDRVKWKDGKCRCCWANPKNERYIRYHDEEWVEALQLMPEGSKWKLYIPSDLAYGAQGAGEMIPPHSTLVFEVELLEVLNK